MLGILPTIDREGVIDAALHSGSSSLDALLVPPDVGQTYQIATQAGYSMITLPVGVHSLSGMPFGAGADGNSLFKINVYQARPSQ